MVPNDKIYECRTTPTRKHDQQITLPEGRTGRGYARRPPIWTALFGGTGLAQSASKTRRSARAVSRRLPPSLPSCCHHHPKKPRYLLGRRRAVSVSRPRRFGGSVDGTRQRGVRVGTFGQVDGWGGRVGGGWEAARKSQQGPSAGCIAHSPIPRPTETKTEAYSAVNHHQRRGLVVLCS